MRHYIHWENAKFETINYEEIAKIKRALIERGFKEAKSKTCTDEWFRGVGSYSISKSSNWTSLFIAERKNESGYEYYDLTVYRSNIYKRTEDVEDRPISPKICAAKMKEMFSAKNGTTMHRAFKTVKASEYRFLVPKPVYYIDRDMCNIDIAGVQYSDVSSMYPGNARGRMPDAHGAVRVEGRALPSEEYPFAFYLRSHHCAERGRFDTHDYFNLPPRYRKFQTVTDSGKPIYKDVPDEEEVTVLMRASKYELTDVFTEVYRQKQNGNPLAKAISVMSIGMFHRNPATYGEEDLLDYYHLAAIILGRSNAQQYAMVTKIEKDGGSILQMVVDSIIYKHERNLGAREKVLGEYFAEWESVNYRAANSINRYVLFDNSGRIVKKVVGGVKNPEIYVKNDIDKYNLKC